MNGVRIRLSQSTLSPSLTSHFLSSTLDVRFGNIFFERKKEKSEKLPNGKSDQETCRGSNRGPFTHRANALRTEPQVTVRGEWRSNPTEELERSRAAVTWSRARSCNLRCACVRPTLNRPQTLHVALHVTEDRWQIPGAGRPCSGISSGCLRSSGEFSDGAATRVGEPGSDVVFRQDMFNDGIELVVNVGYVESECCQSVWFRHVVSGDWSSFVGSCCALVLFVWPEWFQLCLPLMRRAEQA